MSASEALRRLELLSALLGELIASEALSGELLASEIHEQTKDDSACITEGFSSFGCSGLGAPPGRSPMRCEFSLTRRREPKRRGRAYSSIAITVQTTKAARGARAFNGDP